ncbi:hypothetical protein [Clostridium sp.]|uniref:hypothetical protein n=1 Tax=Clostridium sp. TaxID=1506 RepID=UPI002FCBDDDB
MKINKVLILVSSIFLVLMVSCSSGTNNKIVMEKLIAETTNYEAIGEINDTKEVQKVKDKMDGIKWEDAKVDMVQHPEYKVCLKNSNNEDELIYDIWISPKKDKIEIIVENKGKYVQLNEEKSSELFEMIFGRKLADE